VHTPNDQQCAVSETLTIIINNFITIISNARLMICGTNDQAVFRLWNTLPKKEIRV